MLAVRPIILATGKSTRERKKGHNANEKEKTSIVCHAMRKYIIQSVPVGEKEVEQKPIVQGEGEGHIKLKGRSIPRHSYITNLRR